MHPLSDKDLDRLSREAAEQYDVEQNTSGWEKLEQKLNKHLPEKGKKERRRFLFFIWLFALLSGGGLLWILTGTHSSQMITLKEGSSEITLPRSTDNPNDQPSSKKKTKNDDNRSDIKSNDQSSRDQDRELKLDEKTNTEKNTIIPEKNTKQKASTTDIQTTGSKEKNLSGVNKETQENSVAIVQKKKKDNSSDRVTIVPEPILSSSDQPVKKDNENSTASSDNKAQKDIPSPAQDQPVPNKNQQVADSSKQAVPLQIKTDTDSNSVAKKTAASKNKPGFKKGLEIGLVVAPDMSNVKFTNTDKVGYNFGIQLGYRLSQRWSANTGVLYTRKNYTSQGKDFNPPKGSWLDNIKLDMVEGNCYMFDIPLNVRYDLNNGKSHRYFLSTGLSTYLMKKEEYHYHYWYSNGSPGYRYRSFSSSEHHWLSVLNISAGFEKKLNNRLSLQAEPYLKIPLSGVGYGNLQLNSYGMYFLLKLNTNKR